MRNIATKLLSILLAISLVIPMALGNPREAKAIIGVSAICSKISGLIDGVSGKVVGTVVGVETTVPVNDFDVRKNTKALKDKESCGDVIVAVAVNIVIGALTKSIINWANSGFAGKPAFTQNFNKQLKDVGDVAATNFLTNLKIPAPGGAISGQFFCGPFAQEIHNALRVRVLVSRDSTFEKTSRCTIDNFLKQAKYTLQDFEQDFNKGGWAAWLELTQGTNNRYGAYFSAQNELWNRVAAAKDQQDKELTFGSGYLSKKVKGECLVYANQLTQDFVGPTQGTIDANSMGPFNADEEGCVQRGPEKIVLPGQTIQTHVAKALGLSEDRLVAADEINEMIGAVLKAVVFKALSGAKGLVGLSDKNGTTGGKSFFDRLDDEDPSITDPSGETGDVNGGGGGGGPQVAQCPYFFGKIPASKPIHFESAGPYYPADKGMRIQVPGIESKRFYKSFNLAMDMFYPPNVGSSIPLTFGSFGSPYTGGGGRYFFEPSKQWTSFLRSGFNDKHATTAWEENANYHLDFLFDAQTNTIHGKVTNKTKNVVAGDFTISEPFGDTASGAGADIVFFDEGAGFELSRQGFIFSNLVIDMEPGGPFHNGASGPCPGDTPTTTPQ